MKRCDDQRAQQVLLFDKLELEIHDIQPSVPFPPVKAGTCCLNCPDGRMHQQAIPRSFHDRYQSVPLHISQITDHKAKDPISPRLLAKVFNPDTCASGISMLSLFAPTGAAAADHDKRHSTERALKVFSRRSGESAAHVNFSSLI